MSRATPFETQPGKGSRSSTRFSPMALRSAKGYSATTPIFEEAAHQLAGDGHGIRRRAAIAAHQQRPAARECADDGVDGRIHRVWVDHVRGLGQERGRFRKVVAK